MKLFKGFLVLVLTAAIFATSAIASDKADFEQSNAINAFASDTPASAVEQFFYSFLKNDVAMLKKRLSKETIEMMEGYAKKQDLTIDEALKAYMDSKPFKHKRTPKMQKQKLDGDKCTIEAYLDGKWEVIPLVKEDEIWRVDLMAIGK